MYDPSLSFLVSIYKPKLGVYGYDSSINDKTKIAKAFYGKTPKFTRNPACSILVFNPQKVNGVGVTPINATLGAIALKHNTCGEGLFTLSNFITITNKEIGDPTAAIFQTASNTGTANIPPIKVGNFICLCIGEVFGAKKIAKNSGIQLPKNITCTADLVPLLVEHLHKEKKMSEQEAFVAACKTCFGTYSCILLSTTTNAIFIVKKEPTLSIKMKTYKDIVFVSNNTSVMNHCIKAVSADADKKIIDAVDVDLPIGWGLTLHPVSNGQIHYSAYDWVEKCSTYKLT